MLQPLRHTKNCTHDYERLQSENTWNRPSKDVNWVYKWAAQNRAHYELCSHHETLQSENASRERV